MDTRTERALIIMSRLPEKGKIKKRLSQDVGEEVAYKVFKGLFQRCLEEMSSFGGRRILCLSCGEVGLGEIREQWPLTERFELGIQEGRDLGERMKNALSQSFGAGSDASVLIGTDIPGLKIHHVEDAFKILEKNHLVLGPSEDGGYYLIGIRRGAFPWEGLFEGIQWGGHRVLWDTMNRARNMGIAVSLLEALYDLDRGADLEKWLEQEGEIPFT